MTTENSRTGRPPKWDCVPIVFVERTRCPTCKSTDWKHVKTMPAETDESYTQRKVCRQCGTRFVIVHDDGE